MVHLSTSYNPQMAWPMTSATVPPPLGAAKPSAPNPGAPSPVRVSLASARDQMDIITDRIHGAAIYGNMDPINIPQSC